MANEAQTPAPVVSPDTSTQSDTITTPDVQEPIAASAPAKLEKQLKKLMLKVDGEEFEEEYDPNDEEYMTKQFQLAKVAQKRMQDFSLLQKEVVNFVNDLKKNPRKALSDPSIGLDVKQLAAQIIEEEIAQSKKSPEQREKEQLQAEIQEMKDAREREKTERETREYERLVEQSAEQYDLQIDAALKKTDLPKEDYVVKKIADYLSAGLKAGKDISVDDIMPLVREEIINDVKHLINVLPESEFDKFFGKELLDRTRKRNVARAKTAKTAVGANKALDIAKKAADEKKSNAPKKTFKEYFGV